MYSIGMSLSKQSKRSKKQQHIFVSIGTLTDKQAMLPNIKRLAQSPGVIIYATEHTHAFLKKNGVISILVYKISQMGKHPNIMDLIHDKHFDLVINIPTDDHVHNGKEFSDGVLIRKGAISMGVQLIIDPEVADTVINHYLQKND